ncbi:OmpA family protein [Vibrio parahaemolyticus]|uniref:OmpA family protein n=1 Tax=Vibrio parahaemolyticus TaxID=670 RepID=UPI0011245A7A|nr:OmpA family protein [Vibrio parahaemolyticus]EIV8655830.1 OmpA family protein [Vibrio parahaemolyticus]EKG9565866.1 OmpA family protein [Vibrio parahaemolyticus]EKG9665873.1 OmpA family protein [Vibrio parahaemolyticus]EKG9668948.1 OmpA family protein [Vibrio parahaemolyticus]MUT55307.1 OmpA family protein [Vibrio parahaemolyticus]
MKKLVIGSIVISTLQFSVMANAEEGISVYCDTAFSEYRHGVTVTNVVGIAQHRQGFLQVEQKSENSELNQALVGQSTLGLNQSVCNTWIGKQERHGLLARLHFGFDQRSLTPMGSKALNQLAGELQANSSTILVDGHTDNIGTESYNRELGLERALATSGGLITNGIDKNRLVIRSFGESKPIASNATPEGRAQNRRSEIWASENEASE